MEDVVVTPLLHKGGDKPFAWIIVDRLTLKDRMMNARQRARSVEARFFGLGFLFFVSLSKFHRHCFEIEAVLGIGRVLQTGILELFQQKGHAFKPIAFEDAFSAWPLAAWGLRCISAASFSRRWLV